MSIKLKLLSLISAFILVLGLVVTGVLAASSQTITMNGSVNFNVTDKSLWVKEVRMQEAGEDPVIISNFTPGYINGDFNFNVGDHNNNRGSFALYFDIINTTTNSYGAFVDYSGLSDIAGLEIDITLSITANTTNIEEITSDTNITTTLTLTVFNPNLNSIDLSKIIINIYEGDFSGELGALTYTYNDETMEATVSRCSANAEIVIIPKTVTNNGQQYTVTSTRESNFRDEVFANSKSTLKSIVIPNTIETIGQYTFNGCTALESVIFESNSQLTTINTAAFSSCSSIKNIDLPNSLTTISTNAFSSCSGIVSMIIPQDVTQIDGYVFSGCSSLTSIKLSDSTTIIGSNAFMGCTALETIDLSIYEDLISIGYRAFMNCTNLKSVVLPSNLTRLGNYIFTGCTSLISVIFDTNDNWELSTSSSFPSIITTLSASDVQANAFQYLTNTYSTYYWRVVQ